MLRVARLFGEFNSAINLWLVDVSPTLRKKQQETLQCEYDNGDGVWKTNTGVTVRWVDHINAIPSDKPHLVIAHELFDALPTHQFELTDNGWRERLVNVSESNDAQYSFQSVLSPSMTSLVSSLFYPQMETSSRSHESKAESELLEELKQVPESQDKQLPDYVKVVSSDKPLQEKKQKPDKKVVDSTFDVPKAGM